MYHISHSLGVFRVMQDFVLSTVSLMGTCYWNPEKAAYSGYQGLALNPKAFLGRALGHFILSFIGLKRILLTNIFRRLKSPT